MPLLPLQAMGYSPAAQGSPGALVALAARRRWDHRVVCCPAHPSHPWDLHPPCHPAGWHSLSVSSQSAPWYPKPCQVLAPGATASGQRAYPQIGTKVTQVVGQVACGEGEEGRGEPAWALATFCPRGWITHLGVLGLRYRLSLPFVLETGGNL